MRLVREEQREEPDVEVQSEAVDESGAGELRSVPGLVGQEEGT